MNSHDYIEMIGSIGAFISALIALYTVNEIKKQRLSTYKPELFLNSFCVSPSHNPLISDDLVRYKIMKYNDYSKRSDDDKGHISVLYKMENLGFGVAKDVVCEWDFDHQKAASLLQSVMPENYELKRSHNAYQITDRNDEDFYKFCSLFDMDNIHKQKIDYISPIQVQDHENKHTLPPIVIFSYYYYLLFKNKMLNQNSENFYHIDYDNMPKPKLKVSYKDVNDKTYRKEYVLNITASCTQINEDIDNITIDTSKEFCMFYVLIDSSTKK